MKQTKSGDDERRINLEKKRMIEAKDLSEDLSKIIQSSDEQVCYGST